jgi:hypothetical protein
MRHHGRRLLIWGGLLLPVLWTVELRGAEQAKATERRPTLEMLEYLGSMVDSEEGLIGPVDLEDQNDTAQQESAGKAVANKTREVLDDDN